MHGMETIPKMIKKGIQFKTLLTETNEILLVYSDPAKVDHQILVKHFESDQEYTSSIYLKVLTLGRTYEKFFRNKDPALYFKETIFLKNDENAIMFVLKEKKK